jgi:hypothetical protein
MEHASPAPARGELGMRHSTVEDLVLRNHALLAEAEEARARWLEAWNASLIVQIGWLLSSTSHPPPMSPRPASRARYARYERIADAAWRRGSSRWKASSRDFIAAAKAR